MKQFNAVLIALTRAIIASAFWIATRLTNHIEIAGLAYDILAPRTYLGMAHKRDIDPIILIPTLVFHRGWRGLAGQLHFALRGDAFTPGYLGRIVTQPRWLSFLLRFLSIGKILCWLGAHPMDALLRPAEEWIREALQVQPGALCGETLAPFFLEELARATGESSEHLAQQPLSRLLAWRYHDAMLRFYGPEMLHGVVRRAARQRTVVRIKENLADVAAVLEQGKTLYSSPEGQLSPDGKLSQINTAFHRILHQSPGETRVAPIYFSYDFMTTRRTRVFVDFAPPIEHASSLPNTELDAELRARWLKSAHVTCTHLASGYLAQASRAGQASFTLDDLAKTIFVQARTLAEAGRHVDACLLDLNRARRRAKGFLDYAARHRLARKGAAKGSWIPTVVETPISVRPREVGYDQFPLTYACNELQEFLSVS